MSKKTTKIILIAIPIATVIAMILLARWALSSPSLEALITVDMEIGMATLGLLFSATLALYAAINGMKDSINENTHRIIKAINENSNENTRRIIEAIEGQRK